MTRDELEFLISQYVDGTLAGGKREALEARLKLDSSARTLLAEYRAIDAGLKALPLPDVRWDALASQISSAVDKAEEPAQTYRLADYRWVRWTAAAAAALVVAAATAFLTLRSPTPQSIAIVTPERPAAAPIVIAIGPAPSADDPSPATSPVVVAIGPSERLSKEPALNRYVNDVVTRPSQVLIASTARPAQDYEPLAVLSPPPGQDV